MIPEAEQWLPVVGFEGLYEVSDHGRVRSLPRTGTQGRIKAPRISRGYLTVCLNRPGSQQDAKVHQLVAEAFHGPRPDGTVIRHLDGDCCHNTPTNLAYGTPSENAADQVRHGTHANARKTHCPQGHSYSDPANVEIYRGMRYCRPCSLSNRAKRAARDSVPVNCEACGVAVRRDGLPQHRRNVCRGTT